MVPDATFTSYYGRPVVKASPWKYDIPAYFFLGGLGAGSALLAAGADLTGRRELRRVMRIGALAGATAGTAALIRDLGKPSRFLNMLRVAKPTSPMSVGTWVLVAFGSTAGIAATAELVAPLPHPVRTLARPITFAARPAGLAAALLAPMLASYTGVLLADTATPAWHAAHRELPFVFAASAAMAAGGLGMMGTSLGEAGPARRLADQRRTARARREATDGGQHGNQRRNTPHRTSPSAHERQSCARRRRRSAVRLHSAGVRARSRCCRAARSWRRPHSHDSGSSKRVSNRRATRATRLRRNVNVSSSAHGRTA